MIQLLKYFSYAILVALVIVSVMVFTGSISIEANKTITLILTVLWFVSAPFWMMAPKKG